MRRWATILVAILAVSLAATGCFGGDDDDTTSSERPDDTSTTSTTLAQTSTTTTVPAATPTASPTPTRVPGQPLTYVVQEGDLLSTIAEQFGVTVDAIVEANNIDDPNLIQVGQELIIPPPEGETTDAGTDTGGTDAGTDTGGTDAGTDTGGTDAGSTDAATDAGTDA